MIRNIPKLEQGRMGFSLANRPPKLFAMLKSVGGAVGQVPIFEPYEENLPLESGYYSFVINEFGHFHITRGNLSSHGRLVAGRSVGAAGSFRINRNGSVAEVFCISEDYGLIVEDEADSLVGFVRRSFLSHHGLEVSENALLWFKAANYDSFCVDVTGLRVRLEQILAHREKLEREGQGNEIVLAFTRDQVAAFRKYTPPIPLRYYPMHTDQLAIAIEEGSEGMGFVPGNPKPPLSPEDKGLTSGKKAFVLDKSGHLIVGYGHHLLSGGLPVGAAGQLVVHESGLIDEINLNFSGHYRPPLDALYASYTYRTLRGHPLLRFSSGCRILGRKFDIHGELSTNFLLFSEQLVGDVSELEAAISLEL